MKAWFEISHRKHQVWMMECVCNPSPGGFLKLTGQSVQLTQRAPGSVTDPISIRWKATQEDSVYLWHTETPACVCTCTHIWTSTHSYLPRTTVVQHLTDHHAHLFNTFFEWKFSSALPLCWWKTVQKGSDDVFLRLDKGSNDVFLKQGTCTFSCPFNFFCVIN